MRCERYGGRCLLTGGVRQRAQAVVGVGAGGRSQASRWGLVVCSSAAGCGGFSRATAGGYCRGSSVAVMNCER